MNTSIPPGHRARIRYRPVEARDLPECLTMLPQTLALTPAQQAAVPALWERLVVSPALISAVMEDQALPAGQRVRGWGVSMVLPPALVQHLDLDGAPRAYLTRQTYKALLEGRVALPDDREIGRLNAAGDLVLQILHFTLRAEGVDDPYAHKVIISANDSFRAFHDGYLWRAMYYETAGAVAVTALQSGFVPARFADEDTLVALPPEQRPVLFHLTREHARQQVPGSPARNTFDHQPPRFRFSTSQRRLLWHALFDESDDALMPLLDVSVHGLKKLWRGIYERIENVDPEFFGDSSSDDDGKRGPEKRRQVLAYVRQRPEELRAWAV